MYSFERAIASPLSPQPRTPFCSRGDNRLPRADNSRTNRGIYARLPEICHKNGLVHNASFGDLGFSEFQAGVQRLGQEPTVVAFRERQVTSLMLSSILCGFVY